MTEVHHHHHQDAPPPSNGNGNAGVYAILIIIVILVLGGVFYIAGVFGPARADESDLKADIRIEQPDVPDVEVPDEIRIEAPEIDVPDTVRVVD